MKKILIIALLVVVGAGIILITNNQQDDPEIVPSEADVTENQVDAPGVYQQRTNNEPSEVPQSDDTADEQIEFAPDFSLQTPDGETVVLSDFRGEQAVVLDFWASWCPNCQRAMPELDELYETGNFDVAVIGVNMKESTDDVVEFVNEYGISFPVVLDTNGRVARQFGVSYTNTHVMIDKDGAIQAVIPGDIDEGDIESLLQS